MKSKIKKWILISLVIITGLVFLCFYIGNALFNYALNYRPSKSVEQQLRKNFIEYFDELGADADDVYINTTNNGNFKLHGYEIHNSDSNKWAIVIHGYINRGAEMSYFARDFYLEGYNVLVPDLRCHGLSEGKYIGMGWLDRLDIIDWINYIIDKDNSAKIVLFGISMGSATVMMATGEELPNNVKAAICDCGYTSVWDEFSYILNNMCKLPAFPILNVTNTICKLRAHYDLKDASSIEQIKKSTTPTLFIHGSKDTFVPFYMLDRVYEAENAEKEKLVIEGAEHSSSVVIDSELYKSTILSFINKYIDKGE